MERAQPDAIVNGAAYNDVDAAEDHPVDALNVERVRGPRAGARGAGARRDARALQHRFRLRRHARRRRTRRRTGPTRAASMRRRSCSASGSRSTRRAPTCSRREPVRPRARSGRTKGSVASIVKTLLAGGSPTVFEDRTVSPTYVLDAARATRQLLETQAPRRPLSLRQLRPLHLARARRRSSRGSSASRSSRRGWCRCG